MAKYKVNKRFRDKETGIIHEVSKDGKSIDITVKRGDEINETLEKHGEVVSRVHEQETIED